ncbi:hypothetical protein ACHAWT_008249 [Skeletonema menzelii]
MDDHQEENVDDTSHVVQPLQTTSSCYALLRDALRNSDQLTAMISNYSTSYNAVNVGIVLPILQYSLNIAKNNTDEPYTSPRQFEITSVQSTILSVVRLLQNNNNDEDEEEQDSIVASSLLAGMIFGQLIGGYLGDVLGKRKAILLVMILQISGSIGSACISTSSMGLNVLEQLAIWRFILGIGAGGVYPLAAVLAAESKGDDDDDNDSTDSIHLQNGGYSPTSSVDDDDDDDENANHISFMASESGDEIASFRRIALTFSTQGLGFITVPLIAYILLELRCNVDFIWRFLLGIGALPGFVVLFLRLRQAKRIRDKQARQDEANDLSDIILDYSDENDTGENDVTEKSERAESGSVEMAPSSTECSSSPPSSLLLNDSHESQELQEPDNELALVEHSYIESDREEAANYNESHRISNQLQSPSLWESIASEPNLCRKFVGTAGTWFLFDVLFYGNTLFEPLVLEAAFGSRNGGNDGYSLLQTTVRDSLVISLLSLPGYFVTVAVIGKRTCGCCSKHSSASSPNRCGFPSCFPCYQTPTFIQMQGFLFMFFLYLSIGLFWVKLSNMQWLLLLLYAASFFFANYGPNTTTFLLPSVTYSKNCRSTLNGLSAAAGKLGALCGSAAFAPAAEELGESSVMVFCGCVSLLALILTKFCVKGSR